MKHIYCGCDNAPMELDDIMTWWWSASKKTGDIGSCVLGAGFTFEYKGDEWKMAACSPWQGSMSWEAHRGEVELMLSNIGCKNIRYHWGMMD